MSALHNQTPIEAIQMQKMARLKNFEGLESALFSAIEANQLTLKNLFSVLEVVAEQNLPDRTESLVWLVISLWTERKGPAEGLKAAQAAAELLPQSETLRSELIELHRNAFGKSVPHLDQMLEATFKRPQTPTLSAVQQMERFIGLSDHRYALDRDRQVPVKLIGFAPEIKEFKLIENNEETSYSASKIAKLEPLADDDFRALALFERDRLAKLSADNPEELVLLALKTHGPELRFKRVKEVLAPVVPSWVKWWTEAKAALVRSALIETSGGAQPTLTLRSTPISYNDRLLRQFKEADATEDKIKIVMDYLDHSHPEEEPEDTLIRAFCDTLARMAKADQSAIRLAVQALLTRLKALHPDRVAAELLKIEIVSEPSTLLNNVYSDPISQMILNHIRQTHPDNWPDLYAAMLPGASTTLCDWIVNELLQGQAETPGGVGDQLNQAIQTIVHWPDRSPRALVWLYKAVRSNSLPPEIKPVELSLILTGMLTAAQTLKRNSPIDSPAETRKTLTQIRNAIVANDYDLMRTVLKSSGTDYARYLKDTIPRNLGLGDAMASDINKIIYSIHPGLFAANAPPWKEDAVYTTERAFNRKQDELAKLVNVDIAHNAKAIGEAAERGDLRENAEFTAALEERDRLTERAGRLQAELKKAKIIEHSITQKDFVTIGSTVKIENISYGKIETYTFLGPWDAEIEKNVYSYLSPLALAFMGKKVGETVTHQTSEGSTEWKILEISS